jgi:hypothetical protein
MTIEGLQDYAEVRDWIYSRMRGAARRTPSPGAREGSASSAEGADEAVVLALGEVAGELRRVRELLARGSAGGEPGPQP